MDLLLDQGAARTTSIPSRRRHPRTSSLLPLPQLTPPLASSPLQSRPCSSSERREQLCTGRVRRTPSKQVGFSHVPRDKQTCVILFSFTKCPMLSKNTATAIELTVLFVTNRAVLQLLPAILEENYVPPLLWSCGTGYKRFPRTSSLFLFFPLPPLAFWGI